MKKLFYAALLLGLAVACGKTEPIKDSGNNNNENKPDDPARTEWTLTYYVVLPTATAQYMDVEISHKDASGAVVNDETLTASTTSDSWANNTLSAELTKELSYHSNFPEGIAAQLIIKKISVGKVKENYKDIENVLVAKIKLHDNIPDNVTTATLMPFCLYQHEERTMVGTLTCFITNAKSPDLKTFLTMEAASGKKIIERNWGFDYISL